MKILVIPDSFKESLTAVQVADTVAEAIRNVSPEILCQTLPIGDGGEGTVDVLTQALGGHRVSVPTVDALGRSLSAVYGVARSGLGGAETAIIEIAAASGLEQIEMSSRDPLIASTQGTGEIILHALNRGIHSFFIGLGGSATNDGGAGMLQALGARFYGPEGLIDQIQAQQLQSLVNIDLSTLDRRYRTASIQVACDVENPLLGLTGATRVFGPQKGVTPEITPELEAGLARFADLLEQATGRLSRDKRGSGAAGGAGFALMQTTQASFHSGVDLILDITGAEQKMEWADLIITGEGCFDSQSLAGKVPMGVAKRAERLGKPVVILCGVLGQDYSHSIELPAVSAVYPIIDRLAPLPQTLGNAKANLSRTVSQIMHTLLLGQRLTVAR